ncbi:DUF1554 domain-containing protein [Alteromonas sp. 5E99-2]|uniref:DUF1554 domain-containing protein n=1 Tax=Alteromonas sp. 5E99-2 TaxID=2817683 RepID=UPI001A98F3FF|nr:DUF1554 domain-containing protein [Alteromonas sp. 5E99-2]MBO1255654.1 DUF1554 domain-containing protein [Alteromonas sp. 5E99-2]
MMRLLTVIIFSFSLPVLADVRLWVPSTTTAGNIGGRAGADELCDDDVNKPAVASSTTRAFISVSAADEIRDMPSLYNIPTNEVIFRRDGTTQIAPNFAALLNADTVDLTNSIGVTLRFIWTASDSIGSHTSSCNNWNSASNSESGERGIASAKINIYIGGNVSSCNESSSLYCITYTAPAGASASTGLTEW